MQDSAAGSSSPAVLQALYAPVHTAIQTIPVTNCVPVGAGSVSAVESFPVVACAPIQAEHQPSLLLRARPCELYPVAQGYPVAASVIHCPPALPKRKIEAVEDDRIPQEDSKKTCFQSW
mmetsp:Transcript_1080/g.2105  ORF Transcript_1080/g.2105 Transcript_1080/m.2105 type:complete len:119 (-) Transcript_1080:49-405(-)